MAFFCLQDSQHSRAAERYWPSKPCRGERNFWMQRRAAEISLRDRKCHQRPKERNDTDENPHRNGPFGAGREICGLEGLDGGVRSHIRTGLEPELPDNCLFTGYFPEFGPVMEKCTRIDRIFSMP